MEKHQRDNNKPQRNKDGYGEYWHGLQTIKLKNLAKFFKLFNRDIAPLDQGFG